MFGIEKSIIKVFFWTVIGFICFVILFFPLTQILPEGFHSFIPAFIVKDSLLIYIHGHLDFFLGIVVFVVFLTLIITLWRRK